MFVDFFFLLRSAKVPVTIREFLVLLEAMEKGPGGYSVDEFYVLARTTLVKDEKNFDRFDQAFGHFFRGAMNVTKDLFQSEVPDEWVQKLAERLFSEEEMAKLESMSFQELMDELAKRLAEQRERHQGGNRWIGTGGTSPFGNGGFNPAGVRIGGGGGQGRATKVWQRREFRGLADDVEIGTRNIKVALRKLRKFIREGAEDEFDLNGTIQATCKSAGYLDIKMVPERKNKVKVLLFIDVGGTMDSHVKISEELFSAAKTEFKHLEYYYFHNFLYERVWRQNRRGYNEWIPTVEVLNTYGPDYKVIIVGDAVMSPFEITEIGGSIEHWNEESGAVWLNRLLEKFPNAAWLNPEPEDGWMRTPSTRIALQLMENRMYPLTIEGLDKAIRELRAGTTTRMDAPRDPAPAY